MEPLFWVYEKTKVTPYLLHIQATNPQPSGKHHPMAQSLLRHLVERKS
jgi:hypothetical protein